MEKALRKKFVIVTVSMMFTLFGVLWTINHINSTYWSDKDILAILEIMADNGLLSSRQNPDNTVLVEELADERPIYIFVLDKSGNVIYKNFIGPVKNGKEPTAETINKMKNARASKIKVDKFVFSKRALNEYETLIVAINPEYIEGPLVIILNAFLVLIGFGLLILISFYLSRFVTTPAREALEREKRFISDASHELKTPLSAISINAEALELKSGESIHVKNILMETGRMKRLVERLLTLSKLEENPLNEKTEFSLSEIIEEMVLTYESMAFEQNRELTYDIEEGLLLKGNPDEIRQLIAILLDNAIKNSPVNACISLKAVKNENVSILEVTNPGKGISSEDIDHIFDRFYTTDLSRNTSSFGLGLAIAKEIAQRHAGKLTVTSIPDDKTTFTVTF